MSRAPIVEHFDKPGITEGERGAGPSIMLWQTTRGTPDFSGVLNGFHSPRTRARMVAFRQPDRIESIPAGSTTFRQAGL